MLKSKSHLKKEKNEIEIADLESGDELSNEELRKIFKCAPQGGMRRSKKENALVLISDETKLYKDSWNGEILHYTGMGQVGDQDINFSQNKTLNHSKENGIRVFLFEVLQPKIYTYRGLIKLIAEPYQELQLDKNGEEREVWKFPIKLLDDSKGVIPTISELNENYKVRKKNSIKHNNQEIEIKNSRYKGKVSSYREVISTTYERDPDIIEYAKRRANGICELCGIQLDFKDKEGRPFLETHHIKWLSMGGEDTIENTAALCPNCHKRMHIKNDSTDVEKLYAIKKFI
ncbi:HNH endonuclease (plasmid) [Enterococcus sp. 22-H-5-01]|uniref:HNH endonuclease n=1 Tax=Enterococcus sp. 22-H-5-01 TaxID=3418555 RepID=UPI003CFE91C7